MKTGDSSRAGTTELFTLAVDTVSRRCNTATLPEWRRLEEQKCRFH